jgi:hypothetical protein
MKMRRSAGVIALRPAGDKRGRVMENKCAIDHTELEKLSYEFPDEALEIAAITGGEKVGNITLSYCTGLNFCPGP